MPQPSMLVAVAACALAHDIRTQIKAYKTAKLFLAASQAYEETEASNHAQIAYLVSLLEKHNIAPTEFDLIALNYHSE